MLPPIPHTHASTCVPPPFKLGSRPTVSRQLGTVYRSSFPWIRRTVTSHVHQYCSHVPITFSNDTRAPYLLSTRLYRSSPTTPTAKAKAKSETAPRQFRHRPVAHRLSRSALHFLLTQTNVITHIIYTTHKSNCTHILHFLWIRYPSSLHYLCNHCSFTHTLFLLLFSTHNF